MCQGRAAGRQPLYKSNQTVVCGLLILDEVHRLLALLAVVLPLLAAFGKRVVPAMRRPMAVLAAFVAMALELISLVFLLRLLRSLLALVIALGLG